MSVSSLPKKTSDFPASQLVRSSLRLPFLSALKQGAMVGDGAMGSLLYERGVFITRSFDEVNLKQPDLVEQIHREYLRAGAEVIESNTYGANRIHLERYGLAAAVDEINCLGVQIARKAVGDGAYIAGSIGPTGLSAGELRRREAEVRECFAEQAVLLSAAGADLLSIETFEDPHELKMAVESVRKSTAIPIIAMVTVGDEGAVSDGTPPLFIAKEMLDWGADAIGVNCNGPELLFDVATEMLECGAPVCVMPNAGRPRRVEDRLIYLATPENFGVLARRMYKAGIGMVAGCCGTSPKHIARVASAAQMIRPRSSALFAVPYENQTCEAKPRVPIAERSSFGAKLAKEFVVSVEISPGRGLSMEKEVAAAKMLKLAGADIINIPDGPRASVRISNLALAVEIEREVKIETLLHLCCRDHNFLGLQGIVLGAHAMGVRNLVVITGDPPKLGDYPDATAVYDVDSIGLLRMIDGFNQGIDPAGKSCSAQTSYVLATGVEPGAVDLERELSRLKQKVLAGANLVMTQPIYEPKRLEPVLTLCKELNLPIMVGILPLASARNAEFLHNHVPGMQIPSSIRQQLAAAKNGDQATQVGLNIATEAMLALQDKVDGVYIMPPLGRYEMAVELLKSLKRG